MTKRGHGVAPFDNRNGTEWRWLTDDTPQGFQSLGNRHGIEPRLVACWRSGTLWVNVRVIVDGRPARPCLCTSAEMAGSLVPAGAPAVAQAAATRSSTAGATGICDARAGVGMLHFYHMKLSWMGSLKLDSARLAGVEEFAVTRQGLWLPPQPMKHVDGSSPRRGKNGLSPSRPMPSRYLDLFTRPAISSGSTHGHAVSVRVSRAFYNVWAAGMDRSETFERYHCSSSTSSSSSSSSSSKTTKSSPEVLAQLAARCTRLDPQCVAECDAPMLETALRKDADAMARTAPPEVDALTEPLAHALVERTLCCVAARCCSIEATDQAGWPI